MDSKETAQKPEETTEKPKDLREANDNIRKAQGDDATGPPDGRKAGNKPAFDRDR